ncbi:hypothetical protein COBT_002777, partial [Conglomerata obtusa]
ASEALPGAQETVPNPPTNPDVVGSAIDDILKKIGSSLGLSFQNNHFNVMNFHGDTTNTNVSPQSTIDPNNTSPTMADNPVKQNVSAKMIASDDDGLIIQDPTFEEYIDYSENYDIYRFAPQKARLNENGNANETAHERLAHIIDSIKDLINKIRESLSDLIRPTENVQQQKAPITKRQVAAQRNTQIIKMQKVLLTLADLPRLLQLLNTFLQQLSKLPAIPTLPNVPIPTETPAQEAPTAPEAPAVTTVTQVPTDPVAPTVANVPTVPEAQAVTV